MSYSTGDRLVLQSEVQNYNGKIPANIVCTLFSQQNDSLVIVRYGIDEDTKKAKIIGVPLAMLRTATKDDLNEADFQQLLPEQFQPGQKFIAGNFSASGIKKGDILVVKRVDLAINENNDLIILSDDISKTEFKFERSFVDMYFDKYDEEYEAKLGEEVVVNNMNTAPRNYYLPGARMVIGPHENQKVVFITEQFENDVFEVEDVNGVKNAVEKDQLMPITNMEILIGLPIFMTIPVAYHAGRKFKANLNIDRNFLLNKKLQYGDCVEIIENDKVYTNILEDLFEVRKVNDNEPFYLSFAELRSFFEPFDQEVQEDVQTDNKQDLKLKVLEVNAPVTIHELSINGFRFKIDSDTFTLDGKEYRKDDLNQMVQALTKLKEFF